MNKIIAIVGMCGSGKSIACEYFKNLGFKSVYFGGVTIEKLKEEGLEINEANERIMRENLRKQYGMGAFAKILLPRINEYVKNDNVVLDGLYSWDEYLVLKEEFPNLKLVGVICDKEIRYERIGKRTDRPFNREEIHIRDTSEIENLAKGGPISFADYYIFNNGSIEEYEKRLLEILEYIEQEGEK